MKSSSIYFTLILISISSIWAQSQDTSEISSPGEQVSSSQVSSSSESLKENYESLERKINRRKERIESLYFIEKQVFVGYGEGSQTMTQAIRKHIYKAGQTLIEYNQEQIDHLKSDNYTERVVFLKEIDRIQDQLVFFSKQNKTRQTEKKLRKLKTPEEISPVFFMEE